MGFENQIRRATGTLIAMNLLWSRGGGGLIHFALCQSCSGVPKEINGAKDG